MGSRRRFRDVAENRRLPINDWPALTMIQGLRAAQQNLPFMPVQLPEGSTMMERCPAVHFHRDERTGRLIGLVEAQTIDTVLLHAPRADTDGNVEIYGARALDLPIVGAARQVLVTVEEIVPAGSLRSNGRQTILTRNLVTAIAEVPGGAYPTSCLPLLCDRLPAHPRNSRRRPRLARRRAAKAGGSSIGGAAAGCEGAGRKGRARTVPQRRARA